MHWRRIKLSWVMSAKEEQATSYADHVIYGVSDLIESIQ
jgi:hypothetical protein